MRVRPGGPVKKYGRLRVYEDRVEVRGRFKRWRIDRSAPLPMQAAATTRGAVVYEEKTTATRVAAGALIAGPAGGVVGAMAKKRKRKRGTQHAALVVWGQGTTQANPFYERQT
jgi:fructose-1,6-bisphosphatase/inositol monophosphatase family enzyme